MKFLDSLSKEYKEEIFKDLMCLEEMKPFKDRLLFVGIAGSNSYGLATEDSDLDIRIVVMPTKEEIFGVNSFEQYKLPENDTVILSLSKLAKLLLKSNPDTLSIVGIQQEYTLYKHTIYDKILNNINYFLTKKLITASHIGCITSDKNTALSKFKVYSDTQLNNALNTANSSAKSKMYKSLANMLRVSYSGAELLETGTIMNRVGGMKLETLRGIKSQLISIDETLINNLFIESVQRVKDAESISIISNHPNIDKINQLLISMYEEFYYKTNNDNNLAWSKF